MPLLVVREGWLSTPPTEGGANRVGVNASNGDAGGAGRWPMDRQGGVAITAVIALPARLPQPLFLLPGWVGRGVRGPRLWLLLLAIGGNARGLNKAFFFLRDASCCCC